MRGLAVAAVVAYHLGYLRGGFLGVDVFFVLSGYLITGLVLDEVDDSGGLSLRAFWGRRIRRLVPALLVMVTAVVAAALALGWPRTGRRALAIDAAATLTWWANWRQAGGASYWESGESLFRHAWSLSIEEQFYVLWPLILVAVLAVTRRRGWSARACIGAAAGLGAAASGAWMLVLSHRLGDADLSRVYVGTDTRVLAPLIGCLLACLSHRRAVAMAGPPARRSVVIVAGGLVGAATLAALFVQADVSSPALYRSGGFIVAALAAALVVRAAANAEVWHRDPLGWASTRGVVRHLGARSYAIYLWSWPVQVLLSFRWPEAGRGPEAIATVAIALALAELSHRLVESPLRRRTGWAACPTIRRPAWALGVAGAWAAVWLALATALPIPAHQQVETAEAAADALDPAGPRLISRDGLHVMITGDSVAWTIGYYEPKLDQLPKGIGSVDSRAIIGCGLLAAEGWSYERGGTGGPLEPAAEACRQQPEAERRGLQSKPDVVLLFPGAWEWSKVRSPSGRIVPARGPEMAGILHARLLRRIQAAHAVGARFVLVQWSCPGSKAAGVRRDDGYIRWINGVIDDAAASGRRAGAMVDVLEPNVAVCRDADPTAAPTPAKVAATDDEVHITSTDGGRWIWEAWLGPALLAGRSGG